MLQALALLHRIAKQVQPVMRKRGWRVPLLSEFSPKSPNLLVLSLPQTQCHLDTSPSPVNLWRKQATLCCIWQGLNINGGGGRTSEIKIRLRPHNSEGSFFPYEDLLGTMLHELVHNVQGPHNAVFYKLLDEITEVFDTVQDISVPCKLLMFIADVFGTLASALHTVPVSRIYVRIYWAWTCYISLIQVIMMSIHV